MQPVLLDRAAGQSLVEFALLLALVAVIAIVGLLVFGETVVTMMSTLSSTVAMNV